MSGLIGSAGSRSGVIGTTELDYEEGTFDVAHANQQEENESLLASEEEKNE